MKAKESKVSGWYETKLQLQPTRKGMKKEEEEEQEEEDGKRGRWWWWMNDDYQKYNINYMLWCYCSS